MFTRIASLLLIAGCLLFLGFKLWKNRADPLSLPNDKPIILVSLPPYLYLAKEIAGSDFEVRSITSANSNPHSFDPKPKEIASYYKTAIWFSTGDPFEEKIAAAMPRSTPIFNLNEGIAFLHAECNCSHDHDTAEHALDLHTWLSPTLFALQASIIANTLSSIYPDSADLFRNNLETLAEKLQLLDQEIKKELLPFTGQTLLVSHPALGYYCDRYSLHQLSVEIEGKETTFKVIDLVEQAKKAGVKQVITMPQYSNKGAVMVAQELNVKTAMINPYNEDYIENLKKITEVIVKGALSEAAN